MDENLRTLRAAFRAEVVELFDELAELVSKLPNLRADALHQAARSAMRLAHNLKGASGLLGLSSVSELAHALEDSLEPLCSREAPPDEQQTQALGTVLVLLQRLCESPDEAPATEDEVRAAQRALFEASPHEEAGEQRSCPTGTCGDESEACPPDPAPADSSGGAAPLDTPPGATPASSRDPGARGWAGTDSGRVESPPPGAHGVGPDVTTSSQTGDFLRVPAERLDALAGHLDELLALHGQCGEQIRRFEGILRRGEEQGQAVVLGELRAGVQAQRQTHAALARLVSDLMLCVRRVRTVGLSTMAPQWRRVVRDCAQALGRSVRLEVQVGDVEVDKRVLDSLRDPIVHLLRNAVDHGIEPKDERCVLGKPERGTITLRAEMAGARVDLEIHDDGRGLEPDELVRVALERGLIDEARAARLGREDRLALIFAEGFSTSREVSQISGRGMGMASVLDGLRQVGGRYSLESAGYGQGTTFRLHVPLSVIASRGLFVRIDEGIYMLPVESVHRSVHATRAQVRTVEGDPVLVPPNGAPVRLVSLGGAKKVLPPTFQVVVLERGDDRVGLLVSELIDEQECVTRRLPWNLRRLRGVHGAIAMPDGTTAIALDVSELFEQAPLESRLATDLAPSRASGPSRVLVVDDSLTSRTLARNILSAAGYSVEVAVDGADAWNRLAHHTFDLLVTDVEMPGMDGLALTRRVRQDPQLKHLPVVLVTSRGAAADVQAGAAAGADDYLVKGQFDHDKLIQAVERHLITENR